MYELSVTQQTALGKHELEVFDVTFDGVVYLTISQEEGPIYVPKDLVIKFYNLIDNPNTELK